MESSPWSHLRELPYLSHLLQMRGLKPRYSFSDPSFVESHLLQMRGLKPFLSKITALDFVASFTDAWIETSLPSVVACTPGEVASFTDAWIETYIYSIYRKMENVASFTDAWIETICN